MPSTTRDLEVRHLYYIYRSVCKWILENLLQRAPDLAVAAALAAHGVGLALPTSAPREIPSGSSDRVGPHRRQRLSHT